MSIDFSLENIYRSWYKFKAGKTKTKEFRDFEFHLEQNLRLIHRELNQKTYQHGPYSKFIVNDNKRRLITVASVKDRVVHRLVYDYLVTIYDKLFIFDVWSCRKEKGLHKAIKRVQTFVRHPYNTYFYRADIQKFFDSISNSTLFKFLDRRLIDPNAVWLLKRIFIEPNGLPIGNLISQILANCYLHEFDFYVKHTLKIKYYVRYGDDFIVFGSDLALLEKQKLQIQNFLLKHLQLNFTPKVGGIFHIKTGIHFLGSHIHKYKLILPQKSLLKIKNKLRLNNLASYSGLLKIYNRKGLLDHFQRGILHREFSSPHKSFMHIS